MRSADSSSARRRSSTLIPGLAERMSAAAPETWGVAAEVPGNGFSVTVETLSGPATSGFTRPSAVGPRELKPSSVRVSHPTAATASAPRESAGSVSVPMPVPCDASMPAELQTQNRCPGCWGLLASCFTRMKPMPVWSKLIVSTGFWLPFWRSALMAMSWGFPEIGRDC